MVYELKWNESCTRFEVLQRRFFEEVEVELTDEEWEFLFHHPDDCISGFHTIEAAERRMCLPPGSLKNWNGHDPLPSPDPELQRKQLKAFSRVIRHIFQEHALAYLAKRLQRQEDEKDGIPLDNVDLTQAIMNLEQGDPNDAIRYLECLHQHFATLASHDPGQDERAREMTIKANVQVKRIQRLIEDLKA